MFGSFRQQFDSYLRPFLTDHNGILRSDSFRLLKLASDFRRRQAVIDDHPRLTQGKSKFDCLRAAGFVCNDNERAGQRKRRAGLSFIPIQNNPRFSIKRNVTVF